MHPQAIDVSVFLISIQRGTKIIEKKWLGYIDKPMVLKKYRI